MESALDILLRVYDREMPFESEDTSQEFPFPQLQSYKIQSNSPYHLLMPPLKTRKVSQAGYFL